MQTNTVPRTLFFVATLLLGCDAGEPTAPVEIAVREGEAWGPCPMSELGTIDLCNSEALACVPADDGDANACLPVGECPDDLAFGDHGELGWGDVCYARCEADSDCIEGMICASAMADGGSMCAWPVSSTDAP